MPTLYETADIPETCIKGDEPMNDLKGARFTDIGFQENGSAMQLRSQKEGEYVLLFFDSECTVTLNRQKYSIQPFMFLLYPFEQKKLCISGSAACGYHWLHLQLSENCLAEMEKCGLMPKTPYSVAHPLSISEMYKLLQQSAAPGSEDTLFSEEIAHHALRLLLCLIMKDTGGNAAKAMKIPHYERLTALRKEIYLHPSESWHIEDICNRLNISRPYFHKIYLSAFETTCTQDVIRARIACSKRLLKNSDAPVTEISQLCGFETDVYFMRQFKRHVGMTPTAYRRVCRQSTLPDK